MERVTDAQFETWVRENFTGSVVSGPPADWDQQEKEFFYVLDGKQYRISRQALQAKFPSLAS